MIVSEIEHDVEFGSVSFRYPGAGLPAIENTTWELPEATFALVAGLSGSGKSTLLKCLNGLIPHFSGGEFGGQVLVRGEDTRFLPTRALSRTVGFVFQDPEAHSVSTTVEDEIAFGMEQLGVPTPVMRRRVEEMLDLLGLERLRRRPMDTLSGGESQRVSIAAALALQPRILVLDEPTSQLDPWGAEDVLTAVRRLNEDLGITIVMAEHRLERVIGYADRIRLLRPFDSPLDGSPQEVMLRCEPRLCPPLVQFGRAMHWDPLPLTVKEARVRAAAERIAPAGPAPDPERPESAPAVEVRELTVGFGRETVLEGVTFDLRPGELVTLMGRNGTGKTTLLRALMGLHRPANGSVSILGFDASETPTWALGRLAGFLPQRASGLLFHETAGREIDFTARARGRGSAETERMLQQFGIAVHRDRHPHDLSVGEQERVALAATLAGNPRLLLLDEPTRGMDSIRKEELASILAELRDQGIAVLMATHDVELAARVATRVILLGDRTIIAEGPPREILSGSVTFGTQLNKVFGDGVLRLDDVLAPAAANWDNREGGGTS